MKSTLSFDADIDLTFQQAGSGAIERSAQDKMRDTVSVKDFGAVGDDATDDTAAFSAAIAYANARLPENVPLGISQATTINIPAGRYKITNSLTKITQNGGVIFKGEGPASELVISATGVVFEANPNALHPGDYDVVQTGLSDLSIIYPSTPNANAVLFRSVTSQHNFLRNIKFRNVQTLVQLGDSAVPTDSTNTCSGFVIDNCQGTKANIAGNLIELRRGSGLRVTDSCSFGIQGWAGNPAADQSSSITTVSGCNAVAAGWATWDTIIMGGVIYGFDRGLYVDATTGTAILNIWCLGTVFDYSGRHAVYLNAATNSNVGNITIDGCYLVGWDGIGVEGVGTGALFNVKVLNSRVIGANDEGIKFSGAGATFIDVIGNTVLGAQRKGSGNSAIEIGAGVSHFRVKDNDDFTGGYTFAWSPDNGIKIAADLDHYDVSGNDIAGGSANYSLGSNAAGSAQRRVTNNRRATYAGAQTTGIYTAPAAVTQWENKAATTVEVYVEVAAAGACSITKNTTTTAFSAAAGPLRATLTLEPGEKWAWSGDTVSATFFVKP